MKQEGTLHFYLPRPDLEAMGVPKMGIKTTIKRETVTGRIKEVEMGLEALQMDKTQMMMMKAKMMKMKMFQI